MLARLLLAAVVAAVGSPKGVAVHVERVVGARVDFRVSFPQGQPERFVGYADGGRPSWLTTCFLHEFYGKLCTRSPRSAVGPVPHAVLPARFEHPLDPGLISPEALAIAPDGSLLILDSGRGGLFRRTRDGALRLVMPTTADAIAVGRDGSIYLADGGRVQVRTPRGALHVLAPHLGDVRSLALAADGVLYVGASESVVAVNPDGSTRTVVRGVGKFDQLVVGKQRFGGFNPDEIAVGGNGDLFVYSFGTKTIVEVTPSGKTRRFWSTYSHGLATAPDGSIVIGTQEGTLQRIRRGKLSTIVELAERQPFGFPFQEDGVAVGADGAIYTDTDVGNGYTNQTALAAVDPDGHARLLRTTTPLATSLPAGYRASACPSSAGLRQFDLAATKAAVRAAHIVDTPPFDRGLRLSDPSWWPGFYTDQIDGQYEVGRHRVYTVGPGSADPYSGVLARRCGAALVRDSLAIVVGPGVYSDQVSHMFFLDRKGSALLYWQHT